MKLKRIASMALAAAMSITCLAGCGGADSSAASSAGSTAASGSTVQAAGESHKMAVAFSSITSMEVMQKEYLEGYIGPAFNTEFMFSEEVSEPEEILSFLEDAYASGCEGVMIFGTDGLDQTIAKANELGMYVVTNSATLTESALNLPYYMGSVSSGAELTAKNYGEIVKDLLSDGENHNVIIVSGGAGMNSTQHYETTVAILETLQDNYDLTYDQPIEEIARTTSQLEVNTGTDIKILIYPGFAGSDTYVPGLSTILQTGEYDTLLCCYPVFSQFSVAVDEVEKAYDLNIRVASIASLDDATKTAFETQDAFGNPSIDGVLVKPACGIVGEMFVLLYNGITGYADQVRETAGTASMYQLPMWTVDGAEEFATISQLDSSAETYAFPADEIGNLLAVNNPDVDYQTIYDLFVNSTAQSVIEKLGL